MTCAISASGPGFLFIAFFFSFWEFHIGVGVEVYWFNAFVCLVFLSESVNRNCGYSPKCSIIGR